MNHHHSGARRLLPLVAALCAVFGVTAAQASSHREAPSITTTPKVDATDFYMFKSYEAGRDGYVTLIANYLPLQDAYGGPNYFRSTRTRCTRSTSTTTATPRKTSASSSASRTTSRASRCRSTARTWRFR